MARQVIRNFLKGILVLNVPALITDAELLAYLDETLAVERAGRVERQMREDPRLRQRLAQLARDRDQGGDSLGEIWTRERLSCLSRQQLEAYLNRQAPAELADYIDFHLRQLACRFCLANLSDLERSQEGGQNTVPSRRYFDSSAGILRKK